MADPNDPNATPTAGPAPSGGVLSGSETQAFQAGFEQNPQAGGSIQDAHLEVILDVPVTLHEVGRAHFDPGTVEPESRLRGQAAKRTGEPMDILVNGCPVARGEVVVVGEQFGSALLTSSARKSASRPCHDAHARFNILVLACVMALLWSGTRQPIVSSCLIRWQRLISPRCSSHWLLSWL